MEYDEQNGAALIHHPDKPEMNNQLKEPTPETSRHDQNRGMTTPAPMMKKSRHQQNKHKPTPMMKKFRIQLSAQVNSTSGETEFAPGLTYVVVSRVKSLNGLMFKERFDLQRLQKKDGTMTTARKMDECLRLTQQVKDKVRRLTRKVKTAANLVQDDFNRRALAVQADQNPASHLTLAMMIR